MFICLIGREVEKVIFLRNENSVLRFLKGYTANTVLKITLLTFGRVVQGLAVEIKLCIAFCSCSL